MKKAGIVLVYTASKTEIVADQCSRFYDGGSCILVIGRWRIKKLK